MTQETEKNINDAINWLQQTGASIQDFALEQAPLYCQEVVAWEFWYGVTLSAAAGILMLIGIITLRKVWKIFEYEVEAVCATSAIFALAIFLPCTPGMFFGAKAAIKATVSPRLVIVEHLNGLRK